MNLGIYGRAWVDWVVNHPQAFDFIHYTVRHKPTPLPLADLTTQTQLLRAAGIDIVLEVLFYADKAQRAALDGAAPLETDLQYYHDIFGRALDLLEAGDIRHVTLEEENIWWAGRDEFLDALYQDLKAAYPAFSFAQWYSPSKAVNIPGQGSIPLINADAWVFDQYNLTNAEYNTYVSGMLKLKLPLSSIIWASPRWVTGGDTVSDTWWDSTGWRVFYAQLAVNRAHKIPTALFAYARDCPESPGGAFPLSRCTEPCAVKFLDKLVNTTLPHLRSPANATPLSVPPARPSWIPGHCGE